MLSYPPRYGEKLTTKWTLRSGSTLWTRNLCAEVFMGRILIFIHSFTGQSKVHTVIVNSSCCEMWRVAHTWIIKNINCFCCEKVARSGRQELFKQRSVSSNPLFSLPWNWRDTSRGWNKCLKDYFPFKAVSLLEWVLFLAFASTQVKWELFSLLPCPQGVCLAAERGAVVTRGTHWVPGDETWPAYFMSALNAP